MSASKGGYYLPEPSHWPIVGSVGMFLLLFGFANFLHGGSWVIMAGGAAVIILMLFGWFGTVINESISGKYNAQVDMSFRWSMGWFIFSEVMFFAAFFGALFYARNFAVAWLGGEGDKGITGDYLWPEFSAEWPVMANPDNSLFQGPAESMAAPGISNWASYLPFWNTVILLTSSVTVHFAHTAIKNENRTGLIAWLGLTVALGIAFLVLQGEEYIHAYNELGLTLSSGIYGSTFFILTGFHGFHVTLGTFMLIIALLRSIKGHFSHHDCFGFEATSWYWHFVDVVWVCLFFFVYIL
jgi:cytochrome c oxidase subunit 3